MSLRPSSALETSSSLRPSSTPDSLPSASAADFIKVPRWVIYFQAGLLCVIPASCFFLGMAASQLSRTANPAAETQQLCQVSGRLGSTDDRPIQGVVIALPLDQTPAERLDPRPLHPASFQELGNPAILAIQRLGGGVTRTGDAGSFRLEIASPGRYLLIAIAAQPSDQSAAPDPKLERSDTIQLSRWFLPLENLYRGHSVAVIQVRTQGTALDTGSVTLSE